MRTKTVKNILQYIFCMCACSAEQSHTGLEQYEDEETMKMYSFLNGLYF